MRFVKWLLGIVLLLVVVVVVGGYVFLKTFDLNKYKSYAEKIVYEQTGRKLAVKGDASLGRFADSDAHHQRRQPVQPLLGEKSANGGNRLT